MNIFIRAWFFALVIWSIFYDYSYFLIYASIILIYSFVYFYRQKNNKQTIDRKILTVGWGENGNPLILGSLQIDLTNIDEFLEEYNQKNPENKLNYNIIGIKSLQEVLKSGIFQKTLRFDTKSKISPKILFFEGTQENQNFQKLNLDQSMGLIQIQQKLKNNKNKKLNQQETNSPLKFINKIPFLYQSKQFIKKFISNDLGMSLKNFTEENQYGSATLMNIQNLTSVQCYSPLTEINNTNIVLTMNKPEKKPRIVKNEIKIRKIFNLNISMNQIFSNGDDVLKAVKIIESVWHNPKKYLKVQLIILQIVEQFHPLKQLHFYLNQVIKQ